MYLNVMHMKLIMMFFSSLMNVLLVHVIDENFE